MIKEGEVLVRTNDPIDVNRIWKALADANRRKILDIIRESPKTTGEIAEEFNEIGRCAVMKHLKVLEGSSLVLTNKKGKFKKNYINAVPLQAIYERWVKKYEAQWASNLLQLKELAEYESKSNHYINSMMNDQANTITIKLEIPIEANINLVWKCLIEDVGIWWRKDFYTSAKTQNFIIEPFVGGRMYEDYGDDNGLLWANVMVLDAPNNLELKGHLSPSFGGPAMTFKKLALEESEGGTMLTLTDTTFGKVSENSKDQLTAGWKMLYEDTFKKYVESKK